MNVIIENVTWVQPGIEPRTLALESHALPTELTRIGDSRPLNVVQILHEFRLFPTSSRAMGFPVWLLRVRIDDIFIQLFLENNIADQSVNAKGDSEQINISGFIERLLWTSGTVLSVIPKEGLAGPCLPSLLLVILVWKTKYCRVPGKWGLK